MSFFDDDGEETAQRPAAAAPRAGAGTRARRPQPRRPQGTGGPGGVDEHTLIVRRRIAAGAAVVLLIIIVLVVNGCVKSEKTQALKNYNHDVSQLNKEGNEQVAGPLFATLASAPSKQALEVEEQVDQYRITAQNQASRAQGLSAPSEMEGAQRNLLLAYNLRVEAIEKLAGLLPKALGGKDKQAMEHIAGANEILLASDVLDSQRVIPLIQQTLSEHGVHGLTTTPSRYLPNIGWLEPKTVEARLDRDLRPDPDDRREPRQRAEGRQGGRKHGLAAEPTLNHITGGGNVTFTVSVEDSGEFEETNVKVNVAVTVGGKQYKASRSIEKTEPGKTTEVQVPLTGIPTGPAAKVEGRYRRRAGRERPRKQQGHLLGDLRIVSVSVPGRGKWQGRAIARPPKGLAPGPKVAAEKNHCRSGENLLAYGEPV